MTAVNSSLMMTGPITVRNAALPLISFQRAE
jgi:hypothetical protein